MILHSATTLLEPSIMSSLRPGANDAGLDIAHELGHVEAQFAGAQPGSQQSNQSSLDLENKVRVLRGGASAPQRQYHSPSDVR